MFTAPGNDPAIGHGSFENDTDYFHPPLRGWRTGPIAPNLMCARRGPRSAVSAGNLPLRCPTHQMSFPVVQGNP